MGLSDRKHNKWEFSKIAASRIFVTVFILGVFVAGLVWDNVLSSRFGEVFETRGNPDLARLEHASATSVMRSKLDHAIRQPRLDIGLFGNSRAIQVRSEGLGLSGFFNFSVPGTSFLNSVQMLSVLEEHNRTPETVVISIDHFFHEFDGMSVHPSAFTRLEYFVDSTSSLIGLVGIDNRSVVRFAWRFVWNEWQQLSGFLNGARVLTPLFTKGDGDQGGYQIDGSRPLHNLAETTILTKQTPAIDLNILAASMRRLAAIMEISGVEILVYESPLLVPDNRVIGQREASLRSGFQVLCDQYKIDCILGASGLPLTWPDGWLDPTHAPSRALEEALATRVSAGL